MHRNQMDKVLFFSALYISPFGLSIFLFFFKAHGFLHNIYCPFDENMEVLHFGYKA